jgi:cell wall-associated NlpC family hydrolase
LLRTAPPSAPKHLARSAPKHLARSGRAATVAALSPGARRAVAVAVGLALSLSVAFAVPPQADAATSGSSVIAARLRANVIASTSLSDKRKFAVRVALYQRGDPYRYGGSGPHSFDCSGLTSYSWKRAGNYGIPRTSSAQYAWTSSVGWSGKLPGDLLFYSGHVTMYVGYSSGSYWMMEAPHSGLTVRLVPARTTGLLKVGRVRW